VAASCAAQDKIHSTGHGSISTEMTFDGVSGMRHLKAAHMVPSSAYQMKEGKRMAAVLCCPFPHSIGVAANRHINMQVITDMSL
jgi:hypothetical protein